MFCEKCGHAVTSQISFCPKCGTKVNKGNLPDQRSRRKMPPKVVKPTTIEYVMGIVFFVWFILWIKASFDALDNTIGWLYGIAGRGMLPYIALIIGLFAADQCLNTGFSYFNINFSILGINKKLDYHSKCMSNLLSMLFINVMILIFFSRYFESIKWSTLFITLIGFVITFLKAPKNKKYQTQKK